MDEGPEFRGQFAFSYKTPWTHLKDFFSSPLPIIIETLTAFGILWTLGEAAIQFTGESPRGLQSFAFLIAASFIGSLAWNLWRYSQKIPPDFENVSRKAQSIAHWQRPLWEFQLAKVLLAEKIGPFERELQDLNAGRVFVAAEKPLTLFDYIHWAKSRPQNLFQMLAVANKLLLNDFPAALQSTKDSSAEPQKILAAVETLARFYGDTVAFERSARAIMPSEDLRTLHEYQFGWSEPIRDGIHQMFRFLQKMCECDVNVTNQIEFGIVIDAPANLDLFVQEITKANVRIANLQANW